MEKKEVKITHTNTYYHSFLLDLLKQGKRPSQITTELNISKQALNYYLKTLKAKNLIRKVGYGTWEVNKEVKINTTKTPTKQVKIIRGHAFIWNIKLSKDYTWKKYNLKQLNNKAYEIIINNKKVWLGKNSITIYENKDFYGINSHESRKLAFKELIDNLNEIQNKLSIKLEKYAIKPSREHYAMIKNELAEEYNNRKEKMSIRDDFNKEWLWIDFSDGVDELETNKLVNSKQVQDWWNDNKSDNFKTTKPSLINNRFNLIESNILSSIDEIKHLSELHLELSKKQVDTNLIMKQMSMNIENLTMLVKRISEK